MTVERALAADWESLDCAPVSTMDPSEPGGTFVVFLHGYGGTGASYSRLAQRLSSSRVRVCLPESPLLRARGDGRMWWEFLQEDWPQFFKDEPAWDANSMPSRQLAAASTGIAKMIVRLRARYRPSRIIVAGHSQGAMLAMDVAATEAVKADATVVVAGALLIDSFKKLARGKNVHPTAFVLHSRNDQVVPYAEGERMTTVLRRLGLDVRFRAFNDDHRLSPAIEEEFERIVINIQKTIVDARTDVRR